MSVRGRLYRTAAGLAGSRWRACLHEIQSRSAADIGQQALSETLRHALATVPYYRSLGIREPRLEAFPLLSRRTLREGYRELTSAAVDARRCVRASTGGSTGEPVWILLDRDFQAWDYATDMAYMEAFCGVSHREYLASRRVVVWHRRRLPPGVGLAKRLAAALLGQLMYLEPYSTLTHERMTDYLRRINRHRPTAILAFASTLFELAKHARRTGTRMHRPRFILTSVEMLFEPMRTAIEEVFGCPVHDLYAAAEVGRMAVECSRGRLHVLSYHNHVEVLDPQGAPVPPGEVGRVVVTSLHNRAMPLIRYDIGDLVRRTSKPCTCGSPLPLLGEIQGRIVDRFVRSDGALVYGGIFIAMFYEHDWIAQFYVLQEDVDRVRVCVRRTPGRDVPPGALDELAAVVRGAMGGDCAVLWDETNEMPSSPVGKHRHIRSLVREKRTESPFGE